MPNGGAMSVGEIERELARLRMNEDGTLGARSSVLNLIVVTSEESAASISRLVCELSGRYPSRAILMISDPVEEEANLEVGLSAFCSVRHEMPGGDQVCAEQITLHVEGPPAGHLESLVGPLLVPDLPVFLWYPDGEIPSSPEGGLAALADRLILDSGAAGDCKTSLRGVASLLREESVPAVGDLQWAALSPWRALVADLFAPPERAGELGKIERVEILHSGRGECRALLFAGWLSATLGWHPESADRTEKGRELRFAGHSGKVTVELAPGATEAAPSRVRLSSGECSFQVSRYEQRADARSSMMRGDELVGERTVHLGSSDVGALLGEELRITGRDEAYESAVERAAMMLDL